MNWCDVLVVYGDGVMVVIVGGGCGWWMIVMLW